MKTVKEMQKAIEEYGGIIVKLTVDGGAALIHKGSLKGCSVIWSFGGGWEHVSVAGRNRCPTWEEMCELKSIFWRPDEACVQYHPAENDYVNMLPYCLHIWRPIEEYSGVLPIPPSIFVGVK